MNTIEFWWLAFIVIFTVVYAIDLYVTNRKTDEISVRSSLKWTGVWISIAILFSLALYIFFPHNPESDSVTSTVMGIKFISGYLTEYSLSVDNLFVFIMIFSIMGINKQNQPKLLKLGIMISVFLRILFILVGMELIETFHWIIYLFGVILIGTAYKMAFTNSEENVDPKANILYKAASWLFPIDPDLHTSKFFTLHDGKRHITNTLLALLVIGSTDILFAIDSIPAIIGVIKEGSTGALSLAEENFLAISSNVFAVMGLISLFFALKGIMDMFHYLKTGVSFILFFIGGKMLFSFIPEVRDFFSQHTWFSLAVIVGALIFSIILSLLFPIKKQLETNPIKVDKTHRK